MRCMTERCVLEYKDATSVSVETASLQNINSEPKSSADYNKGFSGPQVYEKPKAVENVVTSKDSTGSVREMLTLKPGMTFKSLTAPSLSEVAHARDIDCFESFDKKLSMALGYPHSHITSSRNYVSAQVEGAVQATRYSMTEIISFYQEILEILFYDMFWKKLPEKIKIKNMVDTYSKKVENDKGSNSKDSSTVKKVKVTASASMATALNRVYHNGDTPPEGHKAKWRKHIKVTINVRPLYVSRDHLQEARNMFTLGLINPKEFSEYMNTAFTSNFSTYYNPPNENQPNNGESATKPNKKRKKADEEKHEKKKDTSTNKEEDKQEKKKKK